MPTIYVYEYKPEDFERFFVVEDVKGYIDVLESSIVNLDRVMQGKDPAMIIDRYSVLRDKAPDEFIDKVKEQQELIMRMQRALWEYEKSVNDYRANVMMLQARVSKLQEQLVWYQEQLTKAVLEIQSLQQELVRLRDEVFVRGVEAEALERGRRRLVDVVDRLSHIAEMLTTWREAAVELEAIAKAPKPEEKKEVEAEARAG
jgi:chromosome segregation ATPase